MDEINAALVERYQIMLQQDPNSKVFAPLTEAYRKMGLLDEALRIAETGVKKHPQFPSGRVALAKVYIERDRHDLAAQHLSAAVDLSPENILAHSLLADCLVMLKRPREALRAFKMVLFLNPNDERAQKTIKKLESLTASDYDEDVFQLQKLRDPKVDSKKSSGNEPRRSLERYISLADAYIARNDAEKAIDTLEAAENALGRHPEIEKRNLLLKQRAKTVSEEPDIELPPPTKSPRLLRLESLLERIAERRLQ